ncbi:MAG TPA: beta-N-acetylhexosaminidase [Steroidobacteraceae bacterium]|nr:beta-N-acetylhexosaminidase [Steroidobacteraceae bacterium]
MSLGPLMIDLEGTSLTAEERELLAHPLVGGVILFARNYADPAQLAQLAAAIHAVRSPPLIVAVDQEGGRVQRFREGFSRLPPARRIGKEFDLDPKAGLQLARALGWLMAAELRARGVDLSFAPCVDLDYGVNEAIGDRAFHADPDAVAQLASAWMHGMRDAGMAATAKHFPGHGAVVADSHLALPVDRRPLVDLGPELTPYRRLIANGLPAVMVAHIQFPAMDQAPASLSRYWIRDVLRGELGFQGVVFADDLSMKGAAAWGDVVSRSRQALGAGCDMLPVCNHRPSVIELLDKLDCDPQPTSSLRLVRLHGRGGAPAPAELERLPQWAQARELLARVSAPPELNLDAGDRAV